MPLSIPDDLKKITPYVRRAEELDKDKSSPESRLVAYYCRQYAVQQGIPLSSSSEEAKACLGTLLGDLEGEKEAMDNFSREEAAFLCRKFATSVFDRADGEDRMGMASKHTARNFYAAANFLSILHQFYNDGDESVERADDRKRIIYAKWKASEILKAIKEGKTPTPGGYGEEEPDTEDEPTTAEPVEPSPPPAVETVEEDEEDEPIHLPPMAPMSPPSNQSSTIEPQETYDPPSDDNDDPLDMPPPPAYPGPPLHDPKPPSPEHKPPAVSFDLPPPPAPEPKKSGGGMFGLIKSKGKPSKAQIADATELTRFAMAALEDKDVDTAAEHLKKALAALGK